MVVTWGQAERMYRHSPVFPLLRDWLCLWTARATLSFQSQALLEGSAPLAQTGQTSDSFPKLEGLQVFSGAATPAHSSFLISQPGNCDGFRSSNAWVGVGSW